MNNCQDQVEVTRSDSPAPQPPPLCEEEWTALLEWVERHARGWPEDAPEGVLDTGGKEGRDG